MVVFPTYSHILTYISLIYVQFTYYISFLEMVQQIIAHMVTVNNKKSFCHSCTGHRLKSLWAGPQSLSPDVLGATPCLLCQLLGVSGFAGCQSVSIFIFIPLCLLSEGSVIGVEVHPKSRMISSCYPHFITPLLFSNKSGFPGDLKSMRYPFQPSA